jgi:CRP-like cAMP-binding protein
MDNGEIKETLRRLLYKIRLALTRGAVEALVKEAAIVRVRENDPLFGADDASDFVSFLIAGVMKVVCAGSNTPQMTLVFAKPGQFITTGWLFEGRPPRRAFGARAHEFSSVAMWSQHAVGEILTTLPPMVALQVHSYAWRAFSRLLWQRFQMLDMSVRERLLFGVRILARDWGEPWPSAEAVEGARITLILTCQDLAEFVIASRARVSEALGELRDEGLIATVDDHMLVTRCGLARDPRI